MALSDLTVYSEYAYAAMTEIVNQQTDLFNAASLGTIVLESGGNQGDFNDKVFWKSVDGLVNRRNAYGTGTITPKVMTQLVDTSVKFGSNAYVRMDPSDMKWIQVDPQTRGAAYGQQLAKQVMIDKLNTAIAACYAALSGDAASIQYDGTADTPATINPVMLQSGVNKMGDASSRILAWVGHSAPWNDYLINMLTNTNRLFRFETINIIEDVMGRRIIISDIPSLYVAGTPKTAYVLGLTQNAITVEDNNDYVANEQSVNGGENIITTLQQEWSNQLQIKGYSWNKTSGGKSPNNAAMGTAANWTRIATSFKDLAGVIIKSH